MSELRSALEGIQGEDLSQLGDEALEEDFLEVQRAAAVLEAERLRRLAEIDRRRPWLRNGFLSTSSWVVHRTGISHAAAVSDVRVARSLEQMPATRKALDAGEISSSAARVLVRARESEPEAFPEAEALLVDAARRLWVRELYRVVAHWRNAVDSRRGEARGQEEPRERRHLHVSPTVFGMVRIDGDLDPENGELVITALRSIVDAEIRSRDPEDRRTPSQHTADAMGEICRQWLDGAPRPEIRGERPHVTVTVDVEALRGSAGGRCELDHAGPIHPEVARLLACDASVARVILAGPSEPLDVGRRTPVVPASLRRAVVIRDRHCRFPGCDRPPAWTDCHHIAHWARGGTTALANLVLLCRRHHRAVHAPGGFRLELADGRPVFHRPDGSRLEERAPPQRLRR
jgi:hypothetical protein